jgi:acyl carrier protein
MTMTHDEVFDKVRDVLVDALGVDDEEVTPTASLTGDLGAESIDFLDIVFRLEKAFGIKIQQGEMLPENVLQNPEFVADGKITDKGLEELRSRLPHADLSRIEGNRDVTGVMEIFTVNSIVKFVQSKLK